MNMFQSGDDTEDEIDDDVFEIEDFDSDLTPEGTHRVRLVDLEKKESNAGNPMWVWSLMVVGGEANGDDLVIFTAITPQAMWKLSETVKAFGLATGRGAKFNRDDAIGKEADVIVIHQEYEGRLGASVKKAMPIKGGGKKKAAGRSKPAAGRTRAGGARRGRSNKSEF
jgi:hypothetical protein